MPSVAREVWVDGVESHPIKVAGRVSDAMTISVGDARARSEGQQQRPMRVDTKQLTTK